MSDETKQPTAAPEQGSGPQGPQPTEPQRAAWPGLAQTIGAVAGASVFVTGGAFLLGWRYTVAFYDRLGIPTRALHLQPADYVTAKVEIWYTLISVALAFVGAMAYIVWHPAFAAWVRSLARWLRKRSRVSEATLAFAAQVGVLGLFCTGGTMAFSVGWAGVLGSGDESFLYPLALGISLVCAALWWAQRATSPRRRALSTAVAAWVLVFFVLQLPSVAAALGGHDADALLAGPEEGRGARFVAAEPLRTPGRAL